MTEGPESPGSPDRPSPVTADGAAPEEVTVFVTVGSDHHPFDRLVGWVDQWARERGVACLIQHGPAAAPSYARGLAFMPHDELLAAMARATVVVAQGGPMSVVEARAEGRLPITVPRLAKLGEVVDDHQVAFCRQLAEVGSLALAETEEQVRELLDQALARPEDFVVEVGESPLVEASVRRFAAAADGAWTAAPRDERPRVVFIGGYGRSGTTLLERLIGESPEVQTLGEVLYLWKLGLQGDEVCGCGLTFADCAFWQDIGHDAFGGWDQLDQPDVAALRHAVVRTAQLPALALRSGSTTHRLNRNRLLQVVNPFYRAARRVAGGRVLTDASKHPAYAYLLRLADVDLRVVLVVRDPRGVAYSWRKVMVRPEITSREQLMPRYNVAASALRWVLYNTAFEALRLLRARLLVVRYEDLVAEPGPTVRRILNFADVPGAVESTAGWGQTIQLAAQHSAAGNPMRFQTGDIALRLDTEWRTAMGRRDRRVVSAITAPLRWRYGYRD